MRFSACTVFLFFTYCAINPQSVLNSTITPTPGSIFPFRVLNESLDLSTTGTGQTWDFSQLGTGTETDVEILAASSDPEAVDFPQATHVVTGLGPKTFYRMNANGWEILGFGQFGANVVCSNGLLEFPFPMNFNQQSIDLLNCSFNQFGITYNRTGAVTSRYDATGTLILPQTTISDVIRVRVQELSNDAASFQGIPISNQNLNTTWYFFKPGVPFALLVYSELQGTLNPTQVNTIRYNSQSDLSVAESNAGAGYWLIQPGATGVARVMGAMEDQTPITYRLLDQLGRVVRTEPLETVNRAFDIPLTGLAHGVYILNVQFPEGMRSFKILWAN